MQNIFTKYQKVAVVVSVIGVVMIAIFGYKLFKGGTSDTTNPAGQQEFVLGTPVDVVLDYYAPWLAARQSTTSNPFTEGLAASPILSEELRSRLVASEAHFMDGLDPVLCQSATNTDLRLIPRLMNEQPDKAQVLVLAKGLPAQAVITLKKQGEGWYLDDIACAAGEFEPEREFTFDREGNLLKDVPKPLDSKYWHLVFTEDGKPGHTAPLFFDDQSMCTAADGTEGVCDQEKFRAAEKALVQGEMTETGVTVKKLKLLE